MVVFSFITFKSLEKNLRTIVYIDSFNLYFGAVKRTPYRWLDLSKLVLRICREQNPSVEITAIKYFTADIKVFLSQRGQASWEAQQDYLTSLKAYIPHLEIIKGSYDISIARYHPHSDPVGFGVKHDVWRAEEKQTDVNIAINMLCDAHDNKCEQMVLFTNDSDLAPALCKIKERNNNLKIGVVVPIRGGNRKASVSLQKYLQSRYWGTSVYFYPGCLSIFIFISIKKWLFR
ncbi:MAG: NYN domain-containing protein [Thiotrichaceae bacterium]|nr:NYN domain-containing protein [Thiotrichaceae bacterium]